MDDHQRFNAAYLVERGAACLLDQREAGVERLAEVLGPLLVDRSKLAQMAVKARESAVTDSTDRIVSICLPLAGAVVLGEEK